MIKNRQKYMSPKVKVVRFMVEQGFAGSGERSFELKDENNDPNSMETFEEKDYGSTNFFGDPMGS